MIATGSHSFAFLPLSSDAIMMCVRKEGAAFSFMDLKELLNNELLQSVIDEMYIHEWIQEDLIDWLLTDNCESARVRNIVNTIPKKELLWFVIGRLAELNHEQVIANNDDWPDLGKTPVIVS